MKQGIFDCDYIVDDERIFRSPENALKNACSGLDSVEDVKNYLLGKSFAKAYRASPPEIDLAQIFSDRMEDIGVDQDDYYDMPDRLIKAQDELNKMIAEHWETLNVPDISSEEFCIMRHYGDGLDDKIRQILETKEGLDWGKE